MTPSKYQEAILSNEDKIFLRKALEGAYLYALCTDPGSSLRRNNQAILCEIRKAVFIIQQIAPYSEGIKNEETIQTEHEDAAHYVEGSWCEHKNNAMLQILHKVMRSEITHDSK